MSQITEHNRKKRMARKMLTKEEKKGLTPLFTSEAWQNRASSRVERSKKKIETQKKLKEERAATHRYPKR